MSVNIVAKSLQGAWIEICQKMVNLEQSKKVGNTLEINNVSILIEDVDDNLIRCRDSFSLSYYLGESIWYGAGANDVEFISKFGKIWQKLTDDGVTNNSAYGYILKQKHGFDQIEKMIELLKIDPNSRRAVMNINTPRENVIETKDEFCTIALQVYIRDGKLNMTGIMRSNDLWTGTPYDIFYFTEIQKYIARSLGVPVGYYQHFVTSLHIYERNIDQIEKSIDNYYSLKYDTDVEIDGQKLLLAAPKLYNKLKNSKDAKNDVIKLCKELNIVK